MKYFHVTTMDDGGQKTKELAFFHAKSWEEAGEKVADLWDMADERDDEEIVLVEELENDKPVKSVYLWAAIGKEGGSPGKTAKAEILYRRGSEAYWKWQDEQVKLRKEREKNWVK